MDVNQVSFGNQKMVVIKLCFLRRNFRKSNTEQESDTGLCSMYERQAEVCLMAQHGVLSSVTPEVGYQVLQYICVENKLQKKERNPLWKLVGICYDTTKFSQDYVSRQNTKDLYACVRSCIANYRYISILQVILGKPINIFLNIKHNDRYKT